MATKGSTLSFFSLLFPCCSLAAKCLVQKFRRVTIRGAQPSARLSEEICLSKGSAGVSPRVLWGSAGFCGGPRDFPRFFGGSDPMLFVTLRICWTVVFLSENFSLLVTFLLVTICPETITELIRFEFLRCKNYVTAPEINSPRGPHSPEITVRKSFKSPCKNYGAQK